MTPQQVLRRLEEIAPANGRARRVGVLQPVRSRALASCTAQPRPVLLVVVNTGRLPRSNLVSEATVD